MVRNPPQKNIHQHQQDSQVQTNKESGPGPVAPLEFHLKSPHHTIKLSIHFGVSICLGKKHIETHVWKHHDRSKDELSSQDEVLKARLAVARVCFLHAFFHPKTNILHVIALDPKAEGL